MLEKFISENIIRDIKNFETNKDLYDRYLLFCDLQGENPLTKLKFSNSIIDSTSTVKHRRMKNYVIEKGIWGVKLLPCKY